MLHAINDIDELIGKYLAGEASAEEIAFLEQWQQQHEANRQYVNQFRLIFQKAAAVKEWQEFDTDTAWNKVRSRLNQKKDDKVRPLQTPPSTNDKGFSWLRIAASIVVVLGIGLFVYRLNNDSPSVFPKEVISGTETLGDTLPDGSDVYLNRETKLSYAFNKKKNTHVVKLKGEAYFQINHEDEKKFLVDADGVFIRDIGTSFNVTAYPDSNTVEVVVEEGEVEFFTDQNAGIRLKAGGKGIYDKKTKTFTIDRPEENVLAYKTKFFSFSQSDLGMVVASLNAVYDKKIIMKGPIQHCHLTVSFNDENIHEIVNVLAETFNLTVKETKTEFILEGSGCEED